MKEFARFVYTGLPWAFGFVELALDNRPGFLAFAALGVVIGYAETWRKP